MSSKKEGRAQSPPSSLGERPLRSPLQLRGQLERALETDDLAGRIVCGKHDWLTALRVPDGIVRIEVVEVEHVQDIEASGSFDVLEDGELLGESQVEIPVADGARNVSTDWDLRTADPVVAYRGIGATDDLVQVARRRYLELAAEQQTPGQIVGTRQYEAMLRYGRRCQGRVVIRRRQIEQIGIRITLIRIQRTGDVVLVRARVRVGR